jgi:hypothetical protein
MKRTKDPEWTSRLLRAFSLAALASFCFGGILLFDGWRALIRQAPFLLTFMMVIFWVFFIPLYIFTVRKSAAAAAWDRHALLQEQKKADLMKRATRT